MTCIYICALLAPQQTAALHTECYAPLSCSLLPASHHCVVCQARSGAKRDTSDVSVGLARPTPNARNASPTYKTETLEAIPRKTSPIATSRRPVVATRSSPSLGASRRTMPPWTRTRTKPTKTIIQAFCAALNPKRSAPRKVRVNSIPAKANMKTK